MKKIYLIMTAALAVVSCTKEMASVDNAVSEGGEKSFYAEISETKVALGELTQEGKRPVTWVAGDEITVFGRNTETSAIATFTTTDSGKSAKFTGTIDDFTEYGALYCKGDAPKIASSNKLQVLTGVVPYEQKYADGSECLYVAGFTSGTSLSFIPASPVIKFTIKESDANKLSEVKFIGNSEEKGLGGAYNYNVQNMNLSPKTGDYKNYVSYKPESGKIAAGTYYLPVFTQNGKTERVFEGGVTFVCTTTKGAEVKVTSQTKLTLTRGHIADFGTLNPVLPQEVAPYEYPAEPTPCIKEVMGILYGETADGKKGELTKNINFVTEGINDGFKFNDYDCSTAGFGIYTPGMGQFKPQGANKKSAYDHYIVPNNWKTHKDNGYILYEIPATGQDIKGELEFGCCQSSTQGGAGVTGWVFSYSTDNQANWKVPQAVYSMDGISTTGEVQYYSGSTDASYGWKRVILNIPETDAVKAGKCLYIKVVPVITTSMEDSHTIRVNVGAYLKAKTPNVELTGSNVIFAENFKECECGIASMGHLVRYMNSYNNVSADATTSLVSNGWTLSNIGQRAGCVFVNGNKQTASITTPALTALGDTPTDVILTFRACNYMGADGVSDTDGMTLSVSGGGELGTLYKPGYTGSWTELSPEAYTFKVCYVQIKGATKNTKITIGCNQGSRFYLDDIVVTK